MAGVVPDTVYRRTTDRQVLPVHYLPLSQNYEAAVSLHVRTVGDPMALLPAVRRTISDVDPRIALVRPRRLVDEFNRSLTAERTMVKFVGGLSIALVLASVGLYGVMAYTTRQRTTEIGLRLLFGVEPSDPVTWIAVSVALMIVGVLACAVPARRAMQIDPVRALRNS